MKKLTITLFSALLLILSVSCGPSAEDAKKSSDIKTQLKSTKLAEQVEIKYHGNLIYHFRLPESENTENYKEVFAKALSSFLSKYPGLEVVSIAGEGLGFHGANTGYTVCCKYKYPLQK